MFNQKRIIILLLIISVVVIGLTAISAADISEISQSEDILEDCSYNNPSVDSLENSVNNNNHVSKNYNATPLKEEDCEIGYVYVNTSGNPSSDGHDYSDPTTFDNAWQNVENNNVILLLGDENTVYNITQNIKTSNLKSGVRNVSIMANSSYTVLNFFSSYSIEVGSNYNINMINITFMRNYESGDSFIKNNADLTLTNCSFNGIKSSYNKGIIYNNGNLILNDCKFFNNTSSKGLLYNENAYITLNNCLFEENIGEEGCILSSIKCYVNIFNSSFKANNASFGSVFLIRDNSYLNVNKSSFIDNSAKYYGGVINSWYSSMIFDNSIFLDNHADVGGVVYSANNVQTMIINSLLENNSASIAGNVYSFRDTLVIENNAIINSEHSNSIYCYNTSYLLDNNWWGVNNPDFSLLTNNLLPNNWRLMTVNSESEDTEYRITVSINNLTGSMILNKDLFNRTVYFTSNNGSLAFEKSSINSNVSNTFTGNLDDLYVRIDNQIIGINEKITPYLSIANVSGVIDENTSIVVQCNPDITDNINIKVNNISLMSLNVHSGIGVINYIFNDSWIPGSYVLSASLEDCEKYKDLTVNASLVIKDNVLPIVNTVTGNVEEEENVTVGSRLTLAEAMDYQTSVKDQKSSGSCWAFAALSTLESAYLKAYGIEYNFSENNMKNVLKKYSIYGDVTDYPDGGNNELEPISYLVGWYGPVDESVDSYDEYSIMSANLNSSVRVEDVYFYYRTSYAGKDNKLLKEAVAKYGAVATSLYAGYIGSSNKNLYKNTTIYSDHSVSIVGWDDFYSKDNFYGMNKPEDNGAYIIKNSWGEIAGDHGYQYVSYYDTSLGGVNFDSYKISFNFAFPVKEYENYTHIYQHDTVSDSIVYLTPSAWIRNVYTAQYDESIAGIGTYIYEDCDYEAYVYVNDKLCYVQNGTFTQEGYRIIKLDKYVSVKKDDIFRVDLKIKAHVGDYNMITIQNTNKYKSISKENQSFMSTDGENWIDLYSLDNFPGSAACLKVYTKEVPTIASNVMNQNDDEYVVTTQVENLKGSGRLYYRIDDSYYLDDEGKILYIPVNEDGNYSVTLHPHNNNYKYNLTVNLEIEKYNISEIIELKNPLEIIIETGNYTYHVDELQEISAILKVTNADNMTLNTGKVYLYENSVPVDECDVTDGRVIFTVNKTCGNYEYVLVYNCSEAFNCQNVSVNLIILKNDVVLTIDDIEDVLFNNMINITGTLKSGSKDIDGEIVLNINGLNYDVDVADGIFSYEYKANITGINNITAYYDGNDIYNMSCCNKTFEVNRIGTMIFIDSVDIAVVNDTVKISGKIVDDIHRIAEIDKINIIINNKSNEVSVNSTGHYEYSFKVENIGTNNVTVIYGGNQNYIGCSNKTSFTVTKINTKITPEITVEKKNDKIIITGILSDQNNNKITNEEIIIKINNETLSVITNDSGIFSYSKIADSPGLNNVSLTYKGNYYYNSTNINKTFTVEKKKVTITLNIENTKYDENLNISGSLTDEYKNIMNDEIILISLNDKQYNTTTDDRGNYVLITRAKTLGINNITVRYQGNEKYEETELNISVTIDKQDVVITHEKIRDIQYGDNVTITGKFTDANQNAITNSNVNIYINGKQYKARTDNTGTYTLTTQIKSIGENNVTLNYAGNIYYNTYETTTTFNTNKQDILITYDPITDIAYGDNVTITGKFTDKNLKAITKSNVNIYINEKQYKAKTDNTGSFTITTPVKAIGTNNVTLSYGGNTYYNSYETNTTFNAGKQDLIITYERIEDTKYNDNVTISGRFTDKNNKAITKSNVNIYINGKQYKSKTDNTGLFTLITQVKTIGTNNVTLSYGGNTYYNSYETNTTFNAGKQDLIITYERIEDTKYNDNVTISGRFTDKNNKAITKSNVNIYINGKQYKSKTDNTGLFTLITQVKTIGTNNVTLSYGGNIYYNSYFVNTTFTAAKQDLLITVNDINDVAYGDNVTIIGKFTDKNGKAITRSNVNIYINGVQFKAKTDTRGMFTLTAPVKYLGTNNVTLSYGGNIYYNSYFVNTTFTAAKQDLLITVNEIEEVVIGDNVTITGKFTDKNGKAISKSNVNIYINGKQYKAKTDTGGMFTLSVQTKVVGTNNVTCSYSENAYYYSCATNSTFNVMARRIIV